MFPIISALLAFIAGLFRARASLCLEHLALRHQPPCRIRRRQRWDAEPVADPPEDRVQLLLLRGRQWAVEHKPRQNFRYVYGLLSRPYAVGIHSNSSNCCVGKALRACRLPD
jgi:hypothetical protein